MEDVSRFFIKKTKAPFLRKEKIDITFLTPVSEREAIEVVKLIERNPVINEIDIVKSKCRINDRASVHDLSRIGWRPDDGIEGFSKELDFPELKLKAILGISCNDKQILATVYRT
ncbi:MAG: hypothetical protein ACP5LZ_06275 [Fervidicoccaceae archaeon]